MSCSVMEVEGHFCPVLLCILFTYMIPVYLGYF